MTTTAPSPPASPPPEGSHHEELVAAWDRPPGIWGWLCAVNHKNIGRRFMVTAFVYLLLGGVLALMMRTQLAVPDNQLLGNEAYNQTFTMHGTVMMFLFAVPFFEGLAMFLVPLMIGTRDLPFPRLGAFGYWAYLFGGVFVLASIFTGAVPDGGWFAYVPLTSAEYSPGDNLDFWLLGITFVEIAGIVGAIEIIVAILRHRAPGMTLARMPLFVWAMLATALMMLFAFTTLATASALLEIERAYGLPFFDPQRGGDPLLWQHLFWIFGHPEVYIIFLPAAGIASMVISAATRRRIAAYRWLVLSTIAIAFLSFGLWVHHMFATGIPFLSQAFFAAASMMIAIPSGILVFGWIGSLWAARRIRWSTSMLFVVGFVAMFVIGGITGVMVAMVPFNWQAHDSHFVVAHLHYVLVGGAVFPVFAALHHWWPLLTGRALSERLGRVTFWTMFVGFNITFLPQHIVGLAGMPRRVARYGEESWAWYNLVSTIGSYLLGLAVLVFVANVVWTSARSARGRGVDVDAVAIDGAGTLEWAAARLPPPVYNFERLPVVDDLHPVWHPAVPEGDLALLEQELRIPNRNQREVWGTSAVDAEPEELVYIAGPSGAPLGVAVGVLVAMIGLMVDNGWVQVGGVLGAAALLVGWFWPTGGEVRREIVPEEERLTPPAPARRPHVLVSSMWGAGALFAVGVVTLSVLVYVAVQLAVDNDPWPPPDVTLPGVGTPIALIVALAFSTGVLAWSAARRPRHHVGVSRAALVFSALVAAVSVVALVGEIDALPGGLDLHAYQASLAALLGFGVLVGVVAAATSLFVFLLSFTGAMARDPGLALQLATAIVGGSTVLSIAALVTYLVVPRIG